MKKISLVLLSFFLFTTLSFTQEIIVPRLTSPVMDLAQLMTEDERQILEKQIREIHNSNGPQIQVLTVKNLQGYTIEEFSIRVAEEWKIGDKDLDNGIIITVAKKERKARIEVGNGIEGELTDFTSSNIIQNYMIPNFKNSDYASGLQAAIDQISYIFDVNIEGEKIHKSYRESSSNNDSLKFFILMFLFICFVFEFLIDNFIKRFITLLVIGFALFFLVTNDVFLTSALSIILPIFVSLKNSGGGTGGSGSSFGGGSSWSGGGGGFSGGGSSGSW